MPERRRRREALFWGLAFALVSAAGWCQATGHPLTHRTLRFAVPVALVALGALVALPPRSRR